MSPSQKSIAKFHKATLILYYLQTLCVNILQRCQHLYMNAMQAMNKSILSLMQTHPAHPPSHFINNAYLQGFNGDTLAFPISSLNNKPSPSVSECLISNSDQPTISYECITALKCSGCITGT